MATRPLCSGGSWGLGAMVPAILWGPLEGCDQRLPGAGGRCMPPEANAFWQQYIENWPKIRSLGCRPNP